MQVNQQSLQALRTQMTRLAEFGKEVGGDVKAMHMAEENSGWWSSLVETMISTPNGKLNTYEDTLMRDLRWCVGGVTGSAKARLLPNALHWVTQVKNVLALMVQHEQRESEVNR